MRETQPKSIEYQESWIPDGVQEALQSDRVQRMDHLWGVGERHFFGPIGECMIAFYPEHQTIEYENLELYLVFKKPSRLTVTEGAVYIDTPGETQTSFFAADRDGGVSLVIKPKQLAIAPSPEPITAPPVSDQAAPWEVEGSASRRTADSDVADLGSNAEYRSPEPNELKDTEHKQRIKLTGRLARPPHVDQTPSGKVRVKLILAEHPNPDDPDETVYHRVYATQRFAERIAAEELRQGEEVRLEGSPQERTVTRNGKVEQEVQIYAYTVKRTRPKKNE